MNLFSLIKTPWNWLAEFYGNTSLANYRYVTTERALSLAPIWYGVNKISGHIGQMPMVVYKRLDRGAERVRNHQLSRRLRRPNDYQIPSVFKEQIALQSIIDGNGRAAIVRSGSRIVELIPMLPDCTGTGMIMGQKVHVSRPPADDRLRQFFPTVNGGDAESDPRGIISLDDSQVLHIQGLGTDGVAGLPLRQVAKQSLLVALGAEERVSKQMQDGFSGTIMLHAPKGTFRTEEDAKEFLSHFEDRHFGSDKAGKPGMLREGMTAELMESSNRETEMHELRHFQRQDAALWLGLEQILGDDSSVSYNSLEQKNLAYLQNCLNRWLKKWEEEVEYKLLPRRQFENESHFVRFNTGALLKSDFKSSVEALSTAITSTIISRNEAREKLDLNPVDGGDVYENPAITPGHHEEMDEEEVEPESDPAMHAAVISRVSGLIGTEANRVKGIAAKADNFLEAIDNFYDKWVPKLAGIFEEIGLDRELASLHCQESKERILDVADHSTPETLGENIAASVEDWRMRAHNLPSLKDCHV